MDAEFCLLITRSFPFVSPLLLNSLAKAGYCAAALFHGESCVDSQVSVHIHSRVGSNWGPMKRWTPENVNVSTAAASEHVLQDRSLRSCVLCLGVGFRFFERGRCATFRCCEALRALLRCRVVVVEAAVGKSRRADGARIQNPLGRGAVRFCGQSAFMGPVS